MDLRDQQLKYEEDTDNAAAAERLEQLRASAKDGDVELPRAQRYIARAYTAVKQSLDDALAVKTRGVGGKFKGWLRKIPTDTAAVLALRECIAICVAGDRNNKPVTIQLLGLSLGKLLELEVRIRDAESVNPLYMKRIHEQVQEHGTTSQAHLRKLYNTAYHRVMHDDETGAETCLSQTDMLNLGKFAVQACLDAGVITAHSMRSREGTMNYYELAPEVLEFLTEYTDKDVQLVTNKSTGAMMCPPDPWTNLRDGGYLSPRRKLSQPLMSLSNIRKSERARLRKDFTAEKMPKVFEAVNYMQSVPFAVHRPTLDAIVRLWRAGGGVMGVPTKSGPQKPEFPFGEDWDRLTAPEHEVAEFTAWKRRMAKYYDSLKSWRGRVREISGFIKTVQERNDAMWFPMFMDKRGRLYYRGTPNPQGSDLAKATLHFHKRKPLGKLGVYWLKVHIANCAGYDKTTFDDRAHWTEQHWPDIERALLAPEDHADVWGKDAPWCMYSAAWELMQAYQSGNPEAYESGVIVHMDATCSGLQHFSAILRDPVGGSFVNLIGDECATQKQDIYSKVALNAMRVIEQDTLDPDPEKAAIALWWLRTGIPRGMAKKPVMTYVYGATLRGTVDFVEDYVRSEMGVPFPEGLRPFDVAQYAAKKLFQGIAATVPAAEAAMQWLRNVARQMPRGQRMEWKSPTGFQVQHDYMDYDEVRVKLRSCGVIQAVVREYNDDTKPLPMQNAIAPNFVHALDAAHITFTALDMKRLGLDVVGIHDSYGTHACDVTSMHGSIRDCFIDLYQGRNVLSEFLWEVNGVGEVPMRGTLDLEHVRNSQFFFC
jgi:DNA-directed RNA polymerase